MGARGPVPKRDAQRRRRNKPEVETTEAAGAEVVPVPKGSSKWHPVARRWFDALAESGQSRFYEPSDWATAELLAESMSRDLREQVVGVSKDGDVVKAVVPINGARLASYLKGCSLLLVTEGDRRRARLELGRAAPESAGGGGGGSVSWLDAARRTGAG